MSEENTLYLPHAIILTGGIATGKSSVSSILKDLGYPVVDADTLGHLALRVKKKQILDIFGEDVLEGHEVSRIKLAQKVFSDPLARKLLESVVHPFIFEQITLQGNRLEALKRLYVLDIPLYFETNRRYRGACVWCVVCSGSEQIRRLMNRNNLALFQARMRIASQIPLHEKIRNSDVIILNTSTFDALRRRVSQAIQKMHIPGFSNDCGG